MGEALSWTDSFVKLVFELRELEKKESDRHSQKREHRMARLRSLIDAELEAYVKDRARLIAWVANVRAMDKG